MFSRGKVRKHQLFRFDEITIKTVSEYNYLRIIYDNTFNKNRHLSSANKSMFVVLHRCYKMKLPRYTTKSI